MRIQSLVLLLAQSVWAADQAPLSFVPERVRDGAAVAKKAIPLPNGEILLIGTRHLGLFTNDGIGPPGYGQLARNDERGGYSFIQRRQHGIVRPRQLRQVAVGGLPPRPDPRGKPRDVVAVGDEPEGDHFLLLEPDQDGPRLRHGQSILRSLRQNSDEPQLRDRASKEFVTRPLPETQQPPANAIMELVFEKPQGNQCVHIKQISHGRFDRMSAT